jgi:hypothetical protein
MGQPGLPREPAPAPDRHAGHAVSNTIGEASGEASSGGGRAEGDGWPVASAAPDRPAFAGTRRRVLDATRLLLPPLVAFVLATALLWVVAARTGYPPREATTWARWDSGQYVSIATRGYYTVECTSRMVPPDAPPGPQLCGNTGWFPLYPWAMRAVSKLGLSVVQAGVLLAALFHLLSLVLVWALVREPGHPSRFLVLLLAAVFPGVVYQHAVFPVSMMTFFTIGFLYLLGTGRWIRAGVSGAAAAASYISGVLLAPVAPVVAILTVGWWPGWRTALRSGITAVIVAAGFVGVLIVQYLAVGIWGAYFQSTRKYGVGIQNPVPNFVRTVSPFVEQLRGMPVPRRQYIEAVQTLAVAGIVVLIVAATLAPLIRGQLSSTDWAVLVTTIGLWIFPHVSGVAASQYRSEALLLPCVLLARRLPLALQAGLVAVSIAVLWIMAPGFFTGLLR